jgi:hypothetical protein
MSFGARLNEHRRDWRAWRARCPAVQYPLSRVLASGALALWILMAHPAQAQSGAAAFPEDAVKAVFLYRFAGYVQWPMSPDARGEFAVAVLGDDAVAERLAHLLPDHPIHGVAAQAHRIQGLQGLGSAQMLYIGPDYDGDLGALIARLHGRAVLIVTDRAGALNAGSMVNFLTQSGHVRFEVSLAAARQAGLTISSDLLAVAQRVKTGDGRVPPLCATPQGRSVDCAHRVAVR